MTPQAISPRMIRLARLVFPAPGAPRTIIPRLVTRPASCQANGSQHTTSLVPRCRPIGTPTAGAPDPAPNGNSPAIWVVVPAYAHGPGSTTGVP